MLRNAVNDVLNAQLSAGTLSPEDMVERIVNGSLVRAPPTPDEFFASRGINITDLAQQLDMLFANATSLKLDPDAVGWLAPYNVGERRSVSRRERRKTLQARRARLREKLEAYLNRTGNGNITSNLEFEAYQTSEDNGLRLATPASTDLEVHARIFSNLNLLKHFRALATPDPRPPQQSPEQAALLAQALVRAIIALPRVAYVSSPWEGASDAIDSLGIPNHSTRLKGNDHEARERLEFLSDGSRRRRRRREPLERSMGGFKVKAGRTEMDTAKHANTKLPPVRSQNSFVATQLEELQHQVLQPVMSRRSDVLEGSSSYMHSKSPGNSKKLPSASSLSQSRVDSKLQKAQNGRVKMKASPMTPTSMTSFDPVHGHTDADNGLTQTQQRMIIISLALAISAVFVMTLWDVKEILCNGPLSGASSINEL